MRSDFFQAEHNSRFEPWVVEHVCRPVLGRIPESVHPNTLSLLNHALTWLTFLLAYGSRQADAATRAGILTLAGLGLFGEMLLDCLDGMQARRTNRCSKLGEMMDHWLDAVHVPLVGATLAFALQIDPWALILVHVSNAMIYNAQLVLYHHTGRFVHPPTSGADAQFGGSLGLVAIGLLLYFFPRETPWVAALAAILSLAATFVDLGLCRFYYVRLGKLVAGHLPFVAFAVAFGALYAIGAMDALAFVLVVTFLSFRITGSYVLDTILGKPYSGFELDIPFWIVATAAAHAHGGPYAGLVPYLACTWMAVRNLLDFARHFSELKPAPARTA